MHSCAQVPSVSFGNAGDQVRGPGKSQRGRKAADDRDDLPLQSESLQGFINIDRSPVEAPPRDENVFAGRIAGGRDFALAQRVPHSHDANETVPEQALRPHLRTSLLPHDAGFQIDGPVAKRRAVLVRLLHEAQPNAGRLLIEAGNEGGAEVLYKAFAGPQRKGSDELFKVELLGRP